MDRIIINVGRQFGSGGRDVAAMLAERFGCRLYDRELLNLAAKESGFSERFFERTDERKRFFRMLPDMHLPLVGGALHSNRFTEEGLFLFQSQAIRRAAEEGSCVFVGRCADYILRDLDRVTDIFITADIDERIAAVVKREGCTESEARRIIHDKERARASYYNYYTGKRWGDSASYDLCVNSSTLGLQATAELIAEYITKRFF